MKYRPEVDGLRAIAVLPVILYHAGVPGFSGGYLGVDIFFVISGYLITTLLIDELDRTGKLDLAHFYERRARRILPALGVAILLTLALSPFVLIPGQIKDVGQSIVAAALFFSNYFFYNEIDYFNPFASQAPLLHTWSLSVEEQFYLAFPLLLMGASRIHLPYGRLIAVIFMVSFTFALITVYVDPLLAFYSIHTRAWELAAGAAVALFLRKQDQFPTGMIPSWLSSSALVVLIASLTLSSKDWAHPSWFTLIPVAATALLIAHPSPGSLVWRLLTHRMLVHLGLLSYGLYLYHNPLFSFIELYFDYLGEKTAFIKVAVIPLIYALASVSLHLVERPCRHGQKVGQRSVLVLSSAGLALVASFGLFIHEKKGFQSQISTYYEHQGLPLLVDTPAERIAIQKIRETSLKPHREFTCDDCRKVLLIGDSLSDDSYLALANHGSGPEYRRVYLDDTCMQGIESVAELKRITSCRNKSVIFGNLLDTADAILLTAKWQESTYLAGYDLATLLQKELDVDILVVGAAMFTDLGSFSIKAWRSGYMVEDFPNILYRYQRWDRLRTTSKLEALVHKNNKLDWISRQKFFCINETRTCKLFDEDGAPLIWDSAHLTARALADYAGFLETSPVLRP